MLTIEDLGNNKILINLLIVIPITFVVVVTVILACKVRVCEVEEGIVEEQES